MPTRSSSLGWTKTKCLNGKHTRVSGGVGTKIQFKPCFICNAKNAGANPIRPVNHIFIGFDADHFYINLCVLDI